MLHHAQKPGNDDNEKRESAVKFLEQSPLFAQLGDSARHALAAHALPQF